MSEPDHRVRRRGVRASRIKLTKALVDAGLKTQAALAEKLADLEGLEGAPRDVVNRVFREQAVDPQTLERVARALGVDARALYLTDTEGSEPEEHEPAGEAGAGPAPPETVPAPVAAPALAVPGRGPGRRVLTGAGVALLVVLAALAAGRLFRSRPAPSPQVAAPEAPRPAPLKPKSGRFTLAVINFRGDGSEHIAETVRERLGKAFGVASAASTENAGKSGPEEVAQRLQLDVVVEGEAVRVGRQLGVRAWMHAGGQRTQVWAESFPALSLDRNLAGLADRIATATQRAVGLPVGGDAPPHFPLAPVQDEYLQGMLHLDRAASELNLKRAITRFEASLRGDSNYAEAHAGLCQALVLESALADEQRHLIDAERSCSQALQLGPRLLPALTAQADLLRRTGRAADGIRLLEQARALAPEDADVLLGLEEAEFALATSGDAQHMTRAIDFAHQAMAADPTYWKPAYWLGLMEFTAGHLDRALAAAEEAQARDANEYTVTNLGTIYFCRKQFDRARDQYLRARALAPGSYVGDEFLGMIYYFLRQYPESARLRKSAIQAMSADGEPEIHTLWGNLGDSYRQMGARQQAADAYSRALEIVERDFVRGIATHGDRASRAWYVLMLGSLEPSRPEAGPIQSVDKELEEAGGGELSSGGYIRLAQAWQSRGEKARAREALKKSAATCPGFAAMPDFDRLPP